MPVVTLETGSNIPFEVHATLDTGAPWDLTGATVTLTFRRPDGTRFTRLAAVTDGPGGVARYVSTTAELDVPGYWCRQWTVTDALGTTDNSALVWFNVEAALSVTPSAAPAADAFVLATRRVDTVPGQLTGGGALSVNLALGLPAVGTPGTYGDATHYPVFTTDAQGRVTAVSVQLGGGGAGVSSFNARTGAVTLAAADVTGALGDLNALAYGAVADGRTVADAAVTSGATALTSATAGFTAADVGKPVCLALVRTVTDAAITTGTATLTSATANFTAADVGKRVIIAAAVGGTYLDTTILSVTNATTVVLAANASSTVTGRIADIIATHNTTIAAFVSSTQVTLTAAAPFTFAGASLRWGTDNRAAFAAALADAAATGKTLYLPSGTFFLNFTAGSPKLSANADFTVRGAGVDRTTLLVGPEAAAFRLLVFEGFLHRRVEISDLAVQGPVTFGSDYTAGAFQLTGPTAGAGWTRLARTRVTGCLPTAFNADTGVAGINHTLEVDRADWSCGFQVLASYFGAGDDNLRRCHLTNSYFHGSREHVWYVHPHLCFRAENCRFEDWGQNPTVTSYALHMNGGSSVQPLYHDVIGCSFKTQVTTNNGGALFSSNRGLTRVVGCAFQCGSFGVARKWLTVSDCYFRLESLWTASGTLVGWAGAPAFVQVANCQFDLAAAWTVVDASGTGARWLVEGNDIRTSATGTIAVNVGSGAVAQVFSNRLLNSNASGTGVFAFVLGATAAAECRGLRVEGPVDNAGCVSLSSTGVGSLSFTDCDFTGITSGTAWKVTNVNNTDKVTHARNKYGANIAWASAGTENYATLIQGVGAALASAATLAPNLDSDAHHVTGTVTITAINLANDATVNRVFGGAVLKLIADGAWALATGGNVQPKASGVAKAVNSVTTLLYDAAAGFWYEV
jgi:hypothetical protein